MGSEMCIRDRILDFACVVQRVCLLLKLDVLAHSQWVGSNFLSQLQVSEQRVEMLPDHLTSLAPLVASFEIHLSLCSDENRNESDWGDLLH